MNASTTRRPIVALAMGDPAGVSPELTAKLVALDEARVAARLVVIGDRRVFDAGAVVAGVSAIFVVIGAADPIPAAEGPVIVDLAHLDPVTIEPGVATRAGGAFALANYHRASPSRHSIHTPATAAISAGRRSTSLRPKAWPTTVQLVQPCCWLRRWRCASRVQGSPRRVAGNFRRTGWVEL